MIENEISLLVVLTKRKGYFNLQLYLGMKSQGRPQP